MVVVGGVINGVGLISIISLHSEHMPRKQTTKSVQHFAHFCSKQSPPGAPPDTRPMLGVARARTGLGGPFMWETRR